MRLLPIFLALGTALLALPSRAVEPDKDPALQNLTLDLAQSVLDAHAKAQAKPEKDYTPIGIAVMAALGALSFFFYSKREPPLVVTTNVPISGLLTGAENYAIVRSIGQGGMGVVYEAVDRALDRKVAIKKLREELKERRADLDQFVKEAKTVAALRHPNIVDIHSIVAQAGEVYLVFEYVEGKTVEDLLKERGRFSLEEAKGILQSVCAALTYAHERQVIHRDLKPSNVMITTSGFVKVMDFGIASQLKDKTSQPAPSADAEVPVHLTSAVRGTLSYMAPEAEYGVVRPESDVYALGVMLYEMLCGKVPYPPGTARDQKEARAYARLSTAGLGVSTAIDELVDAALTADPSGRLRSPAEFWARLAPLAS